MPYLGEAAALFTSFCWSLSAVGFSMAGKTFESTTINRIRISLAFISLLAINWLAYGQPLPFNASASRWLWLMASGIVGLAIGDFFLFRSYQLLGPRIGLLMLSLAPVYSAIIAWLFFGELMLIREWIGVGVTLAGIGWVILAKPAASQNDEEQRISPQGLWFGAIAALGQSIGLVLSKQGMSGDFPPFGGTVIRISAAVIFLWGVAIFQGNWKHTLEQARQEPKAFGWVGFGAFFGPVIGVSASLLSIQHANLGVASTLMALPPVFMLPISYFFFKDRFTISAVIGTAIAILGVSLLLT